MEEDMDVDNKAKILKSLPRKSHHDQGRNLKSK
jgi:hypothetical protein